MAYCILKSYKLRLDPFELFERFKGEKNCFFLDSSLNSGYSLGRYSYLGAEPFFVLKTKGIEPFQELDRIVESYRIRLPSVPIPFLGGAVGYLSYDLGLKLEKKVKLLDKKEPGVPQSCFGFYNTAVIIDHFKRLLYICASGAPEQNHRLSKILAEENFEKIRRLISAAECGNPFKKEAGKEALIGRVTSNFTKDGYLSAVKKALAYIKAGDIYQVNLSQAFRTRTKLSGFEIYRRLRKLSPSHYSAYFDCGDFQILSSSPERFLRMEKDTVITRPMKGTRPRGKDKKEDKILKKSLLASAKDKAELTMIVDLERNDLGRVCCYDSISVDALRELEKYKTVFQTTATISGRLHKDRSRVDLLRACFPGGSVTGCPKIRSMEIIEELEPSRRSIYTGCLGFLSFSGSMDFNILIRTILKKGDALYFSAGGGIVADSDPESEYQETLVKAKAMMEAINAEV